jgi:hypothetical protein
MAAPKKEARLITPIPCAILHPSLGTIPRTFGPRSYSEGVQGVAPRVLIGVNARTKKRDRGFLSFLRLEKRGGGAHLNIQRQKRAREAARRRETIHHGEYLSKRVARCLEAGERTGGIIARTASSPLPVSKILHPSFREFLYSAVG